MSTVIAGFAPFVVAATAVYLGTFGKELSSRVRGVRAPVAAQKVSAGWPTGRAPRPGARLAAPCLGGGARGPPVVGESEKASSRPNFFFPSLSTEILAAKEATTSSRPHAPIPDRSRGQAMVKQRGKVKIGPQIDVTR